MSYINKSYLISSLSSFKSVVLDPLFNGKVDKNQGTANAGKSLKVGTDGNVTLEENNVVTAWETTPSDTKVPSEKLVKDTVDSNAQIVSDIFTDGYASRNLWNIDQKIKILEPNKSSTIENIKPNTTYTLSYIKDNIPGATVGANQIWGLRSIDFYNNSTKINSIDGNTIFRSELPKTITKTFTTPDNCNRVVVTYGNYNGDLNVNTYLINAQLEEGDKATTYAPYAKSNVALTNESNDLKMLGWTVPAECPIQNYVDANGVFHQRVGRVDLGSLDWTYADNRFISSGVVTNLNLKINYKNLFCIKYKNVTWSDIVYPAEDCLISCTNENLTYIGVRDTSYTDATAFKSAMSGQYLYYELATEVTKQVDGNEAVVGLISSNNYSISEKVIGTWIDGKPLYRRTYYKDNLNYESSTNTITFDTSFKSSAVDNLVNMYGGFLMSTNSTFYSIPYAAGTNATGIAYVRTFISTEGIHIVNNAGATMKKFILHIEYTKA